MADIETYASVSMEDKAAAVKRYVNDQTEFARMRVCACCGLRDPIGLLLQTGDYREVKYSAVDSNGALACKIFTKSLGQDVKQYIVAGLRACVESAGRCHSVAGLARSIDAAAHELCFATDERASANVRSASCLIERLWRVDGRFFCVSRAQFTLDTFVGYTVLSIRSQGFPTNKNKST